MESDGDNNSEYAYYSTSFSGSSKALEVSHKVAAQWARMLRCSAHVSSRILTLIEKPDDRHGNTEDLPPMKATSDCLGR